MLLRAKFCKSCQLSSARLFCILGAPKKGALKNKIKISLLFDIVNRDGKVVPRSLVDGRRPDLPVAPVENLERVAGQLRLAQDAPHLKVELVGRVVGRLVPDVLFSASKKKISTRQSSPK